MSGSGIWAVLGIAPGSDQRAIRRAYATRLRFTNPEDDAEAFQALRAAYEQAMQLASRREGVASEPNPAPTEEPAIERGAGAKPSPDRDEPTRLANELVVELTRLIQADGPANGLEAGTVLERLLSSPVMEHVGQRGAAERWLAALIARNPPRSDLLVEPTIAFFGWTTTSLRQAVPGVDAVLRRRAELAHEAMIQAPDHPLHAGWRALTEPLPTGWRRWRVAVLPAARTGARQLLAEAAGPMPGLRLAMNPEAGRWWSAHLSRPRSIAPALFAAWTIALLASAASGEIVMLALAALIGLPVGWLAVQAARPVLSARIEALAHAAAPWLRSGWLSLYIGSTLAATLLAPTPIGCYAAALIAVVLLIAGELAHMQPRRIAERLPGTRASFAALLLLYVLLLGIAFDEGRAWQWLAIASALAIAPWRGRLAFDAGLFGLATSRRRLLTIGGAVAVWLPALVLPAGDPDGISYQSTLALLASAGLTGAIARSERGRGGKTARIVLRLLLGLGALVIAGRLTDLLDDDHGGVDGTAPVALSQRAPVRCPVSDAQVSPTRSIPIPCNRTNWIQPDDYPPEAVLKREQGRVEIVGIVSPDGRLHACRVEQGSGHDDLDGATCRLLTKRARFLPATDRSGRTVAAPFHLRLRWRLP